jgi:hypothetical protein
MLHRERTADGVILVATESGRSRTFPFTELTRLAAFQSDMEAFLRRTGWTLTDGPQRPEPVTQPADEQSQRLRLTLVPEPEVIA